MDSNILNTLVRAKRFYELSLNFFKSRENNEEVNLGIILLQDSVELFLIGICKYLKISYDPRTTSLPVYLDLIKKSKRTFDYKKNKLITNQEKKEVPFRIDLIDMNKMRVDIKHYGKLFILNDCYEIKERIHSFFIEASRLYLGLEFDEISLVGILEKSEIKKYLKEAENYLINNKYLDCMINCRKVLYLLFERKYDIRVFAKERLEEQVLTNDELIVLHSNIEAPEKAKNKDYIDRNVSDPTDYIVLDRAKLYMELLTYGINTVDFDNVIKHTPKVYFFEKENRWAVKKKINYKITKDIANYCFRKTLEFTLLVRERRKQDKEIIQSGIGIPIKGQEWEIFSKALTTSKKIYKMKKEVKYNMFPLEEVDGLKEDEKYIHIFLIKVDDNQLFNGYLYKDLIKKYLDYKEE